MNIAHLFEIQRKLDQHIIEKKGLEGQDLLPKKILALQVELGELAKAIYTPDHWTWVGLGPSELVREDATWKRIC